MTNQLTSKEKRKFVIDQFIPELSAKICIQKKNKRGRFNSLLF